MYVVYFYEIAPYYFIIFLQKCDALHSLLKRVYEHHQWKVQAYAKKILDLVS